MIRIDLLHKKQSRMRPVLLCLAVAAVVVGAGLAGLYWIDQRYPLVGAWNDLWASAGVEEVGDGVVSAGEEMDEETRDEEEPTAPMEGMVAVEPEVAAPVSERPVSQEAREEEKKIAEKATVSGETETAAEQTIGGHREQPKWSAACLWAIKLTEQMPSNMRLTSLTCNASGEYTLEGRSASRKVAEGFLKTLQQLPSRTSLSWWREGKLRVEQVYRYKFTFQGQFGELYSRDLDELSTDQARELFQKVGTWALQSGLGGLFLKEPLEILLTPKRVQQRQKLWATSSYQQIDTFLKQLKQVEDIACLGEVVMVPIYQGGEGWKKARLYAAIDVLVRRP